MSNTTQTLFEDWKVQHGKTYTGNEHNKRFGIFMENKDIVETHNAKKLGWTMALNQFADMTEHEFASFYLGFRPSLTEDAISTNVHELFFDNPPASVDWRTSNMVGPVKNQKACGSCWAFSTIASAEGQVANATGKYVSLSEQNLVDCVKGEGVPYDPTTCCSGCQGGLMDNAFAYVVDKQAGGFDTEESYKYTGRNGACHFSASDVGGTITGFKDVRPGAKTPTPATLSEEANVKDASASVGPLSIAVDAGKGWQLYSGGIMKREGGLLGCSANPKKADHGVAIVGYGSDSGKDYWIVRNSWGATWGEKGYIRLPYGENACGIANFASYPTISK
jgi:C1A family cysteine protease